MQFYRIVFQNIKHRTAKELKELKIFFFKKKFYDKKERFKFLKQKQKIYF